MKDGALAYFNRLNSIYQDKGVGITGPVACPSQPLKLNPT
jgi:hypothetical protein